MLSFGNIAIVGQLTLIPIRAFMLWCADTSSTDEEDDMLFVMSEALDDLAAVEANVTKQAALEWKRLGRGCYPPPLVGPNETADPFLANQAFDAMDIRKMSLADSVCNAFGLHVDDEAARIRVRREDH